MTTRTIIAERKTTGESAIISSFWPTGSFVVFDTCHASVAMAKGNKIAATIPIATFSPARPDNYCVCATDGYSVGNKQRFDDFAIHGSGSFSPGNASFQASANRCSSLRSRTQPPK